MKYLFTTNRLKHWIVFPFIWLPLFIVLVLDFFVEIYHRIAFPLYDMPLVDRTGYVQIDRYKLKYLSFFDKINCAYCGYVNGFAAYFVRIACDTEKYWCGIQHEKNKKFKQPAHHKDFLKYDDEEAYCKLMNKN